MFQLVSKIVRIFAHKKHFQAFRDQSNQKEPWAQRPGYQSSYKAQSEVLLKGQIQNLPKVHVKWVIDGDTVIVTKGWREIRIRLDSIDCPEDGQEWGDTAKYGLIKLIDRQKVHLEEHGLDDYGRTMATIYVWHVHKGEWLNVNERMVMLGHAWVMRMFYDHLPQDRQDKLNRLEKWAKSKNVGLWRASNPIPPRKWRNGSCDSDF